MKEVIAKNKTTNGADKDTDEFIELNSKVKEMEREMMLKDEVIANFVEDMENMVAAHAQYAGEFSHLVEMKSREKPKVGNILTVGRQINFEKSKPKSAKSKVQMATGFVYNKSLATSITVKNKQ